jgi:hypothetical protein
MAQECAKRKEKGMNISKITKISNELYDLLRDIVEMYLPGLGTLYFALASIWGFPYGEAICGTIAAICAFLGLFLKKSRIEHTKPLPIDTSGFTYLDDGEEIEPEEVK